jgi:hypothetical protein
MDSCGCGSISPAQFFSEENIVRIFAASARTDRS